MDEDSDRSSEATQLEDFRAERRRAVDDDDDDVEDSGGVNGNEDDDDDEDEETDDQREASELESSPMEIQDELRTCQSETLASGLADVPIHYEMRHDELERLKNQLQGSHQEALAIVIAQAAQAQSENKAHLPGVPSTCSELSTFCVTPISCVPRSNSQEQTPSPLNAVSNSVAEENQKITNSGPRTVSASRTARTPIDGFNWRKYGQKQVKSTQGSRSYYKCTYADCDAKKIESCDQHNSVTKIVYKGQHKHDPPKKVYTRRGRVVSTSSKALERKANSSHGSKQNKSGGSVSNGPIVIEEIDEPEPKQRVKKRASPSHVPALKPPKKPKFVIHASADVGISADGYRWRKYGQKAVKGNPHPRNYYKCTSTGCPVRKHIEMAMDGSSEVILTYKGVHDHDMPVGTEGHNGGPLHLTAKSKKREPSSTRRLTIKHSNGVGKKSTEESPVSSSGFEVRPC